MKWKSFISVSLLLICSSFSFAQFSPEQQKAIDSLNAVINNAKSTSVNLTSAYVELSEILYLSNPDTLIPLSLKAKEVAEKAISSEDLSAEEKISINVSLSIAINNLGYIYSNKGDISKALEYYHKSLKIREQTNDLKGMANSYSNLAYVYIEQGDVALALEYMNKALSIQKKIDDKVNMAITYNNLSSIYFDTRELDKAAEYSNMAIEIQQEIGDKPNLAMSYTNMGNIYKIQRELPTAINYFLRSLEIQKEVGDKHGMAYTYHNLAGVKALSFTYNNDKNELKEARKYAEKGLELAFEVGFPEVIKRNANILHKIALREGNYKEAYEMRNLEIQMIDSLEDEQALKAAAQQQAKYEYEKAEAVKDAAHQKELEKQRAVAAAEEKRKNAIILSVSIGLVLVLLLSVFLFNRFRVTRKQKQTIQQQKEEVDEKNKEILDSINYAKRIQTAMLPPEKLVRQYLPDSFIFFQPKDIVAGDFYWMETIKSPLEGGEGDVVFFTAADCTGHGVPGAMVSVMCSNALSKAVKELGIYQPAKILDKTVELLEERFSKSEEEVKDGMDLALCSLNLKTNQLEYAGANNPLYHISNGELKEIKADKQPVGKHFERKPYANHIINLQPGDTLYIFSDGFIDQFGGDKGKKYKAVNFKNLLISIQQESMEKQKQLIKEAFENWKGNLEQIDDVCIVGVRV